MGSKATILCVGLCVLGLSASAVRGQTIHVSWGESPPPVAPDDYEIAGLDVELKTGSMTWRIWSEGGGGTIGNLGTVTCPHEADFGVKFEDDAGGPGAFNTTDVDLIPQGETHYSNITGGRLSNLIFGLEVKQNNAGVGGEVDDFILGDINGEVDIPVVRSLTLNGGLKGGHLSITDRIDGAGLEITGNVFPFPITIADIVSGDVFFSGPSTLDFQGTLDLLNGVPGGTSVKMTMTLGTLGVIKLNGKDVAGTLEMLADNFGTISGGAVVTGPVTLAKGAGNAFAGSASFGSVDGPSGRIRVINSADVTGSLTIHGDVDGPGVSILVSGDINGGTISIGSLIASGTVEVQGSITNGTVKTTGDMAGAITVAGDLGSGGKIWIMGDASGDVSIGSDALGDVQIDGDLTSLGSVTVDGALAAAGLAGAGRILVSGMCDGDIAIGKQTDNLTLIHLLGGLDDNAAVEINTSGGVFDAAGDINVGPATPPDPLNDITFDGCIRIHSDGQTPPGGGDLRGGSITVIGCHETSAELNICLDGGDGGEGIDIQQTACFLKADGWSCGTCPP